MASSAVFINVTVQFPTEISEHRRQIRILICRETLTSQGLLHIFSLCKEGATYAKSKIIAKFRDTAINHRFITTPSNLSLILQANEQKYPIYISKFYYEKYSAYIKTDVIILPEYID